MQLLSHERDHALEFSINVVIAASERSEIKKT